VIAHMGFRPRVARDLEVMDPRIFSARKMDLAADLRGKPPRYRTPRVAQWYEARNAGLDAAAPIKKGVDPSTP